MTDEANEADLAEQRQEVIDAPHTALDDEVQIPFDAPEADVLEQDTEVAPELDDDRR